MAIDNCNIICDLLPSYIDGICSEDTRIEVENHLQTCEHCKCIYNGMIGIEIASVIDEVEMAKVTEPFRKINTRYHIKVLSCVIAVFLVIGIVYAIIIPGYVPNSINEQYGKHVYWKHIERLVNITELHYFISGYIDNETVKLESNTINHDYGYVTFDDSTAFLNVRYDCTFNDGRSAIVYGYYKGKHYIFGIISWESYFYITNFIESE